MERREREVVNSDMPSSSASADEREKQEDMKSMIDVTFRMKENEMFADVKVFSFNLILSVDFLMKLSSFLQPPSDEQDLQIIHNSADYAMQSTREPETRRRRSSYQHSQGNEQEAPKKAVFAIHIEEYDVILVEKMDDINCLALILNVSIIIPLWNLFPSPCKNMTWWWQ